ncbi:late blight resistance homolog R1A-10 [Olea europaea subsp. europaea]|uniref:Late blight resistance homolog R1A-10 n=1 Tax=Olea europaea subsp. europaea TaxID=158383 RepID=A0A8S0SKM5_OLEEU|nr:late blight resistance homolog R1A-10 [Olea europaea subsp. europaea]
MEDEDLSYENLSRLVKSPDLLSRLLALRRDGGEKNVSFQWFGPIFLTFLKYANVLQRFYCSPIYTPLQPFYCRPIYPRFLLMDLDDSAFKLLCADNESIPCHDMDFKFFLDELQKLKMFFTIQNPLLIHYKVVKDGEIFIDFLFESIRELLSCHKDSTVLVSNQLEFLQKGLKFLLTFLFYPIPSYEKEQKKSIFTEIEAVFNEAGHFLHSFFFTVDHVTTSKMDLAIFGLLERIEIVLVKIKYYSIAVSSEVGIESPSEVSSSQDNSSPMVEEIVVGLEDTTTQIVSKLVEGPNYRQIISIVGMGGLGKTTLSKKIYNHSHVRYHFHKLSWCVVSQTYKRRKLLTDILSSVSNLNRDDISEIKDEEELAELLYRSLKGRRYLIVVDDLWEKEAWDDLKRLFPDDSNGSRVMFTSRLKNVASEISHVIIELPPLSQDESWNLLEQKVFKKECCPQELQDIGKQIAANCKGLPLLVVLMAGILSNMQKKESLWQQVAKSLSYYIFQKADDYIPTLKLSYIHLPDHLKPCFLCLSAFQEDEEIPIRKLLLLWIVEGFIEKREQKTLEDVAEEYLMELVNRSLLQVSKRRSDNGVKVCTLHDLVLDMCNKMVVEDENFLFQHQFLVSKNRLYMGRFQHVWISENISEAFSIVYNLEKIRILDSSNDNIVRLGFKIMPDLRYLEFSELEPSIGKIHNLEYLCLHYVNEVPTYLLNMPKLRHLRVNGKYNSGARFTKNSDSFRKNCLQTLGFVQIVDSEDKEILRCSPNLRTLKCESPDHYFPDLNFLSQLQSLTISRNLVEGDYSVVKFPMNIKKLSLFNIGLAWDKMSLIGILPNLEILKLEGRAFSEKNWDTKDDEFQKLKFLKLDSLDLEQWNSASYHFPVLERLVLRNCRYLEEIPSEFSYILTLQEIKVLYCGKNIETSALEIHQEQLDYGNTELDVTIHSF